MEHEETNWKCIVNTFFANVFFSYSHKPYSHGISIIWGACVILKLTPTFEFCVVHSHGISEACDFTDLSPGYPDVKALRVPFYGPVRWI